MPPDLPYVAGAASRVEVRPSYVATVTLEGPTRPVEIKTPTPQTVLEIARVLAMPAPRTPDGDATMTYDAGRLAAVDYASGARSELTYDDQGRLSTATTIRGGRTYRRTLNYGPGGVLRGYAEEEL